MEFQSRIRSNYIDINKCDNVYYDIPDLRWRQDDNENLCGSLERQLLFEECLNTPTSNSPKEITNNRDIFNLRDAKILKGEDIPDVPTSYVVSGIQSHEFPVIGTYVDHRIVPGYRYRVRLQHTETYLSDGKALWLKTIGMGYGKRLTFHGESLNNNKSYFWSDSYADGYCFSLEVVKPGDDFLLTGSNNSRRVVVTRCDKKQEEISNEVKKNNTYIKHVKVQFWCVENDMEFFCSGTATVIKPSRSLMASVKTIVCDTFPFADCVFIPCVKPQTSVWEKFS